MSNAPVRPKPEQESKAKTTEMHPCNDLQNYLQEYARQRPEMLALWCFGIGFVIGWRLKPW